MDIGRMIRDMGEVFIANMIGKECFSNNAYYDGEWRDNRKNGVGILII